MQPTRASVEQRRAAEAALQREAERIVESGEYADWFAKTSAFHRYSPTNTLWILSQRPDATRVAPYPTWQQVGRQVRKGEPGIMVFQPKPYWTDPSTGDRVRPKRSLLQRTRPQLRMSFEVGYVFDIAQTNGADLPQLDRPTPADAPPALAEHLDRYCHDNGITVEVRQLGDGMAGYYQADGDRIVIDRDADGRLATIVHELVHREDPGLVAARAAGDRGPYRHDRADCEAVAEAAAHVVSARFGYNVTGHSAGDVAAWIKGDVERFKQLHVRVGHVASHLIPPDRLDELLTAARRQLIADRQRPSGRFR